MGEYVKLDGESIKLGTCEDLYYVRLQELRDWVAAGRLSAQGGNLAPADYLKPEHGFRYRFPFPEEDDVNLRNTYEIERGHTLSAPVGFLDGVAHHTISHSISPKGQPHGGFHFNVSHACPVSKEFAEQKTFKASDGVSTVIQIIQQKQVDGLVWTVARCAYCGSAFRMGLEDALALVAHEFSIYREIHHVELFRRMLAGYNAEIPEQYR